MGYDSGTYTAIDQNARTGDIGSTRPGEEGDSLGDFPGLTIAGNRQVGQNRRHESAIGGIHVGIDRSRLHVVDGDALGAEVARPAAGQRADGGLGRGIIGEPRPGRYVAENRSDIDNTTAFAEMRALSDELFRAADAAEGMAAFREKRPPVWPG